MRSALLATLCLLLFCQFAHATSETRAQFTGDFTNPRNPEGWWGYLGINLGVVDSDSRLQHERDVDGSQFDLRGLASYYWPSTLWVYDFGVGVQNSQFSRGQLDRSVNAVYLEASPRYRLTQRWQVGAAGKLFVLGESEFFPDSEAPAAFIGAAVDYEFPWMDEYPVRVGGRILTDINVDSRQVTMAMIDLQMGMPFASPPQVKTVSREKPQSLRKKVVIEEPIVTAKEEPAVLQENIISHEIKDVNFTAKEISYSLGKVAPERDTQAFLTRLGELLAAEEGLFESIQIKGHTDKLGKPLTNEILSYSRAQLVGQAFAAAGLSSEKLAIEGMADSQPLALDDTSSFKNRRVEITFTGVTDEKRLQELIQQAL